MLKLTYSAKLIISITSLVVDLLASSEHWLAYFRLKILNPKSI